MTLKGDVSSEAVQRAHLEHKGLILLRDPLLNKGTAFTEAERDVFALHGLLPPHIGTLEEQISRRWEAIQQLHCPIDKYMFLRELQDHNETLFMAFLVRYIEELMPIVYTPTVGQGCKQFSHIYRRARGLYLSYPMASHMEQMLAEKAFDTVEVIVVTDGERILGLGDLGAGGMGIPIGKLSLYAAGGGFHPRGCLPIVLDVGTDNPELLNDPMYIGWRHPRVRGPQYDGFIEIFVQAVKARWPRVLLQWEDFHKDNANRLLQKYRTTLCSFNDDIQGTAVVATGALLAATKITSNGRLTSHRYCIFGAGCAGCGIASLISRLMQEEAEYDSSKVYIAMLNSKGLLTENSQQLQDFQLPFVTRPDFYKSWTLSSNSSISLFDVVRNFQPTVLIGVSAMPNSFTKEICQLMASYCSRPIIFPLSNPSDMVEQQPQSIMEWTQHRALIATGSPFAPVQAGADGTQKMVVAQANNVYVFPGIGLGATAVGASMISDAMMESAAIRLSELVSPPDFDSPIISSLLPPLSSLRNVSFEVAVAVAAKAQEQGLCACKLSQSALREHIRSKVWKPQYETYV